MFSEQVNPLTLKFFTRIRRHAAISTGNFETLFKNIRIATLPVAITRLLEEINKPEPDLDRIAQLIGSLPEISTKVLKIVNSSFFNLRSPVLSIQHAVSLLGLDHIRSLALSFAAVKAVPRPTAALFDHQAFWTDSLVRALVARNFARHYCPEQCDDAFTAMLIADVALPVLLTNWTEYYQPVVQEWMSSGDRLSRIEKKHFGWSHAQAGAWILQHWQFPEQLICFVGIHNTGSDCITDLHLEGTIALPLMTASLLPSSLHRENNKASLFVDEAMRRFSLSPADLASLIDETEQGFLDIYELMGLCHVGEQPTLEAVKTAIAEHENG
ncbi:MAG TPA: HDOD domain-containing protein [Desulfobulbaceae bacterium]|nr:HDOD domain-containing protein [Desulfobulbaceae bacterium]